MKKLLFIFFLFIIFNSISFSYCMAAQRCECPDGTIIQYGQTCPTQSTSRVWGSISVDPVTRAYGAAWNYPDSESAQYDAEAACIKNSKSKRCTTNSASFYYTAVAISSDNKIIRFGSSDSYNSAWDDALKKCKKAGGFECEIAMMASSSSEPDRKLWGAIAYDPVSGLRGVSWGQNTQKEAFNTAVKMCGNEGCMAIGFQNKYAAMAADSKSNLKMGYSDKELKEAENEAIKACKKAFKVKSCEIVMVGMSEENIFNK